MCPPSAQVNRAINEDRVQLPADLASYTIKPEAFLARMAPRRDPAAVVGGAGVDAYVSALQGGGGGGRGGDDWGDGTEGAVSGLGAALSAAGAGAGGQLRGSFRHFVWDEAMALVEEEGEGCEWGASRGGPGPVLEQVRRNGSGSSSVDALGLLAPTNAGGISTCMRLGAGGFSLVQGDRVSSLLHTPAACTPAACLCAGVPRLLLLPPAP